MHSSGEVDPAGVTVICISALLTVARHDVTCAVITGLILASGCAINVVQDTTRICV